jgi:hypothetical protein
VLVLTTSSFRIDDVHRLFQCSDFTLVYSDRDTKMYKGKATFKTKYLFLEQTRRFMLSNEFSSCWGIMLRQTSLTASLVYQPLIEKRYKS